MGFFRDLWDDIKGNAKWDVLKWLLGLVAPLMGGIVTTVLAYLQHAPLLVAVIFGLVAGFLVLAAPILIARLRRKAKPRRNFIFGVGPDQGRAPHASNSYGQICWWYRVDVTTERPEGIKGCKGRLLRIRRGEEILFDREEVILTFAIGEQPDTAAKFIYPRAEFPLDLLYITSENEIKIGIVGRQWRYLPPMRYCFTRPGKYLLDILVVGDGVEPGTATIEFDWTGQWNLSSLKMVSQST